MTAVQARPARTIVPSPSRTPLREWAARQVFRHAVRRMPLRVEIRRPNGQFDVLHHGGRDSPVMRLMRPRRFFRRLAADGLIGFGESWMAGDWEADDLTGVLTPFAECATSLVPVPLQHLRRWYDRRRPASEDNDRAGARAHIAAHYDLSNDMFALFLDESMTYSCALWEDGDTLERAQLRKVDRLLDLARVGAGTRVLEIGSGWGALAVRAAERGAFVTALTLSAEQKAWADSCIADAGLADRVRVELCDYRDATGRYDAVLSVEMIEAVGERHWPTYFLAIDRLLAPGGVAALQAITIPHRRFLATRNGYTWIHKYVFPGGVIPSARAIDETLASHTGLRVADRFAMGSHYAATLAAWAARFDAHRGDIIRLGFDDTFLRLWQFYLAYCEAGFRAGYLDVEQMVFRRDGVVAPASAQRGAGK